MDFPAVYRAMAPAESLQQAAGRANREGRLPGLGRVVVFDASDMSSPAGYRIGTGATHTHFGPGPDGVVDPDDLPALSAYYRTLYQRSNADNGERGVEIQRNRAKFDFQAVTDGPFRSYRDGPPHRDRSLAFRMLDDTVSMIATGYDARATELLAQLRSDSGDAGRVLRELQPFLVALPKRVLSDPAVASLCAPVIGDLYEWQGDYHDAYGIAEHTHQFARPEGDDWSEALEFAGKVTRLELERCEKMVLKAEEDGEWLPILHTYDGPLKLYASLPLVDGRLYLGFAMTTITPTGRIGMSHMLRDTFEEMSEDEFVELADEACGNLKRGLSFTGYTVEEKGLLLTLERGDDNLCAGSAIVLDDFHERAARHVGEDKLVVGLISPDHICIAGASSGWSEEIKDWVPTSPDTSGDLVPCVLLIDGSESMEIIAECPTGRAPANTPE